MRIAGSPALLLCTLLGMCLLLAGCSTRTEWGPRLAAEETGLHWPRSSDDPKALWAGEITEFYPLSHSTLSLIFGNDEPSEIKNPVAIAVGKDGRMAIADTGRHGVHLYIPAENRYLFLASGFGKMESPVSVIFDTTLELYVSDSALRKIFIYDIDGECVREIDGAGMEPFGRPTGLTFQGNGGLLHVVDTTRHQVHIYNVESGYLRSIGGRGTDKGQFNFPTHIASDSRGRIFINDAMNFRIHIYDPRKDLAEFFGHHGDGSGDFAMPKGIAVDQWGTIYSADTLFDAVQLFDEEGEFLLTIGSRGTGPGEFWMPSGLFIDKGNKLYVCDTHNGRIQIFQLLPSKPL